MSQKISVIGAGSWGTALAHAFAAAGNSPLLWGRDSKVLAAIRETKQNPKYLPKLELHPGVSVCADIEECIQSSSIVVCVIPTQQIRAVFAPHQKLLGNRILVNASKGLEIGTQKRVSEIFAELAPSSPFLVLSGPSFAEEVVRGLPTAVTLAGHSEEICRNTQAIVSSPAFRVYSSNDVLGVEVAGALKNVMAIAGGIVAGLKLGYNAQAAVITRGLAEIARLGHTLGAQPLTFLGLAGMGDLVLTCTGPLSRNRRLGEALGQGKDLETVRRELGGVAEGYFTAMAGWQWSKTLKVDMPILSAIHGILYEGKSARAAVESLMRRDLKGELG